MQLTFTEMHTPTVGLQIQVDRQLYTEQSDFQRIDVFECEEFGRFLTLDGYMMLTERDEFIYHEMMVHVPMAVLGEKICKNLFLCNRQKTQFYLLMLEGEKVFKTKDLSKQLGVARLSFADAADMERYLDITPGSVSVLGLMNDAENHVQLVIDKPIAESRMIGCHPCINSSTLAIATQDLMQKILPAVHHEAILVDLPEEAAEG